MSNRERGRESQNAGGEQTEEATGLVLTRTEILGQGCLSDYSIAVTRHHD